MRVEHWKIVIAKYVSSELAIYVWRAPGSKTINSRVKWGDGTWSPVNADMHVELTQNLVDYAYAHYCLSDSFRYYAQVAA
jgi:hypothetical protein